MILLGSSRVPSYFPRFLGDFDRERLILLLAATAVLLYLVHLMLDFVGAMLARSGCGRLIVHPQHGEARERQWNVALSYYRGAITLANGSVFALGVWVFLGLLYPQLLLVVLGYFSSVFIIGAMLLAWRPGLHESLVSQFSRLVDVLSGCGFLLVFGALVFAFLYWEAEGLLLGILTLLLCRQMFSRLAMALKSVERLYAHREKALLALGGLQLGSLDQDEDGFFDETYERNEKVAIEPGGLLDGGGGETLLLRREPGRPAFWSVIAPERCLLRAREALAAAGVIASETSIAQLDAGRKGELALRLTCAGTGNSAEHFLLKVFNRRETKRLDRAAALLAVYPGAAAVRLRAVIERDGFATHLYEWAEQAPQLQDIQSVREVCGQALIESWAWPVPETLLCDQPLGGLVERCGPSLWARCQAFSRWLDGDIRQMVDAFAANPLRLQETLGELPLRLHNPDVTADNIFVVGGSPKVLRWERWSLEPIGSGWPLELGLSRLDSAFADACENDEELRALSASQVRLAALAFAFEERCSRWAYLDAFALLGELRYELDRLER